MKTFTETVGANGATLTGYLFDQKGEYANADIRPAVLICPGGGYCCCSDREAEPVALAYLGAGFQAFVLRYTTGQTDCFAEALADAGAALHYLRANAAALHLAPGKIAAVGFSAGGHLAGCLGTVCAEKADALVLGYPVILKKCGRELGKTLPGVDEAVTPATPPTFLFSTSDDRLVPIENSLALLSALAKSGVYFESYIYLEGPHGLSLATPEVSGGNCGMVNEAVSGWFAASVRFLRQVLGGASVAGQSDTPPLARLLANGIDTPVVRLLDDPACAAVLEKLAPAFAAHARQDGMSRGITPRQAAENDPVMLPAETLAALEKALAALRKP